MIKMKWIAGITLAAVLTGCAGQGTPVPEPSPTASPQPPTATRTPEPPTATITITPTEEAGIFEGYYTTSFEVSSFAPCWAAEMPGYGIGFWLEAEPDTGFYELYRQIIEANFPSVTPAAPDVERPVLFTRFEGRVTAPAENAATEYNGYGHDGLYVRQVTVTKVIEMGAVNHQCVIP